MLHIVKNEKQLEDVRVSRILNIDSISLQSYPKVLEDSTKGLKQKDKIYIKIGSNISKEGIECLCKVILAQNSMGLRVFIDEGKVANEISSSYEINLAKEEISFEDKSVLIIDSHNFCHRTYHAIGRVMDDNGEPVELIKGLRNILNFINGQKPDFVIFANEGTRETNVRKEIYPEYKANRESDEVLSVQIEKAIEIIRHLGFAVIQKEGYEADDVIASYATMFADEGANVTIYSTDKDLYQIVAYNPEKIKMYDWVKREAITEEHCIKKFGVGFDKCLYVQAIMGDTADNVPGIKGVGMKKASTLINEYGNLDNIYEHIDDLKGALRNNVETQRDMVDISFNLVSLNKKLAKKEELIICKTPFYDDPAYIINSNTDRFINQTA